MDTDHLAGILERNPEIDRTAIRSRQAAKQLAEVGVNVGGHPQSGWHAGTPSSAGRLGRVVSYAPTLRKPFDNGSGRIGL